MKKIFFLMLTLLAAFCLLAGCGKKEYEPVESTEEEARVVMTLELDGKSYNIKYELYRMLFLNNKSTVDGGDASVWSGAQKDEYIRRINEIIVSRASEIYAVLHLGEKAGIDPYSNEIEDRIYEYIRISVEGNGADVTGHGSYEEYLSALKDRGMNYSVQELLYRYAVVLDALTELYAGAEDEVLGKLEGELEFTKDDVKAYYDSDECARVLHLFFDAEVRSLKEMQGYKEAMDSRASSATDVATYIINRYSPVLDSDIFKGTTISGITVGSHELDSALFSEYTRAAFSLETGEVSEVIEIIQDRKYYYILYKLEKSDAHFNEFYESIESSFIDHKIGKMLNEIQSGLIDGTKSTDAYSEINHSAISMN